MLKTLQLTGLHPGNKEWSQKQTKLNTESSGVLETTLELKMENVSLPFDSSWVTSSLEFRLYFV